MATLKFIARNRNNRPVYQDRDWDLVRRYLSTFKEGQLLQIIIKKFHPGRTVNQNSYVHVVIREIAKFAGHTEEEMKTALKEKFASRREDGLLIVERFRDMDRDRMKRFIGDVTDFAAEFYGLVIEPERVALPEDLN